METILHRQLKTLYSSHIDWQVVLGCDLAFQADNATVDGLVGDDAPQRRQEVTIDGFRIDAVADEQLIEIQYASLGAIRDKIKRLLQHHSVRVVKPLAARKYLVKRKRKNGSVVSSRYSPLRQSYFHLFEDLVHFVGVFPHPQLTLEVLLTEQEEHRRVITPRYARRRNYRVDERTLRRIEDRVVLDSASDLVTLLPESLIDAGEPVTFSTADLAREANVPRWLAQKAAYCLRKIQAAHVVGKDGNALLYQVDTARSRVA